MSRVLVLRLFLRDLGRHGARRVPRRRPAARRAEARARAAWRCRGYDVTAERVLRAGVSATKFVGARRTDRPRPRTITHSTTVTTTTTRHGHAHEHDHSHHAAPQPAGDLHADRPVGAVRRRPRPREGAVSAAGRGGGRDPPDAGRAGPPARSRRARLDHRHRRRGVRARVGRRRPHRLLAAERRRRHGAIRRTDCFRCRRRRR